jgi:hypothetical protein
MSAFFALRRIFRISSPMTVPPGSLVIITGSPFFLDTHPEEKSALFCRIPQCLQKQ